VRLLAEDTIRTQQRSATPQLPIARNLRNMSSPPEHLPSRLSREVTPSSSDASSLSLSRQTARQGSVVFGRASLLPLNWPSVSAGPKEISLAREDSLMNIDDEDDAMDWTPTSPPEPVKPQQAQPDQRWPTSHVDTAGLESLLAQTNLSDGAYGFGSRTRGPLGSRTWLSRHSLGAVCGILIVCAAAVWHADALRQLVPVGWR
jgi:hypothetical protein